MKHIILLIFLNLLLLNSINSQNSISLKGYVSSEYNQGFVSQADVILYEKGDKEIIQQTTTNSIGEFEFALQKGKLYSITIKKNIFEDLIKEIDTKKDIKNNKIFFKVKMTRKPGYTFEISLTEVKKGPFEPVDGITDALIEVYNNTTQELITSFKNNRPAFNIDLNKDNHYTILIRKEGYMAKELEAYLNVNGCIICFHGVSKMEPGVRTRLIKNNTVGKYLANIELDKVYKGKKIKIKNIYYDLNKAVLKSMSMKELDKLAKTLTLNSNLLIELGSHTDSRGSDSYNLKLSTARAKSAVEYLTKVKNIKDYRISYKGYGETQLTNKCDDGVNCTEEQHAANRRTEIKIVNIVQDPNSDFLPLKIMKDNERMEQKLLNILDFGSEIIEIKNGEIPEEIRKDLEKQGIKVPKQKQSQNIETKQQIDTTSNKIGKKTDDIINNSGLNGTFTGYKIVLLFTRYPLPKGHIIFKNVKGIEEFNNETNGYVLYMVGAFSTYKAAEKELKDIWLSKFKKAYIAEFKDGKKI